MKSVKKSIAKKASDTLFERVVTILEQARAGVVRAVNSNMVTAYWLIGREIVLEIQGGKSRAEYGEQVIENLSKELNEKYSKGFSVTNLQYFRKFYQEYKHRLKIQHTVCAESSDNFQSSQIQHTDCGEFECEFSPKLSWSHYRSLMKINKVEARMFYEQEAIACGWDVRVLERQIHSFYYERMLKSQKPEKMKTMARKEIVKYEPAIEVLKNPYVLEFLDLPDSPPLHEVQLESAIINHLQSFLLELGKGFALVARQKRMRFDETDLYVDLVFYNCVLKCYFLIDLKMGRLSHQDVGQMDGYVRMFDDMFTANDDNPTIGLILCTEKNDSVAKYSVLKDRKQIFASKYMLYLPTEKELALELARERKLIENKLLIEKNRRI